MARHVENALTQIRLQVQDGPPAEGECRNPTLRSLLCAPTGELVEGFGFWVVGLGLTMASAFGLSSFCFIIVVAFNPTHP